MNVEIGTEAVQFLFWDYINGIFVAVHPLCAMNSLNKPQFHQFWTPRCCVENLWAMDQKTIKTPKKNLPDNGLYGIVFNRFYRLEIHSLVVGIFDPACELLPPWTKELFMYTVAPLYIPSPPFPN
jgi:hypothetical protein